MSFKLDKSITVVRSTRPVETTVGTEVVLMTLESGDCFGLGETGSDIWRMLQNPTQPQTLIHDLQQIYQAPEGVIEQDVLELLVQMLDLHLVEIVP